MHSEDFVPKLLQKSIISGPDSRKIFVLEEKNKKWIGKNVNKKIGFTFQIDKDFMKNVETKKCDKGLFLENGDIYLVELKGVDFNTACKQLILTLDYCKDVTVLQFWKHEFGQWNEKQVNESIAPVLNKVGAFTANPIIRNIIGQPKSSFDIRKIMDEGKILVVNLSKGLIGEDNAGILGAFLVTKVQLAAMSRSDIPDVKDRRPFYLYVDEFQNFATDSFAVILSEARKYGLNLTVANQYVAQMTDSVRDAVFGNVGTTISFRVSADDAPILVKQFEPTFEGSDLLQLNNRHFIISMIIGGEKVPAFSATTLSIPDTPKDNFDAIVEHSRANYARARADVEAEIRETIEQSEKYKKELSDSGRQSSALEFKVSTPAQTEQKPNFKRPTTPQDDFRRQNLSPNAAEGKNRLGLKDLAKLVAEEGKNETREAVEEVKEVVKDIKRDNEQAKEAVVKTQKTVQNVSKSAENKGNNRDKNSRRKKKKAGKKVISASPVKPEVEYQEKTVVEITPSNRPVSLSTPVKDPDDYAEKDNSVDGFLAIKH